MDLEARLERLEEVLSQIVEAVRMVCQKQDAMDEAATALELAQDLGQASAAVAAIKLRADLAGHLADKQAEKPGALSNMDVDGLLAVKQEVEARIQRAKDALDIVGAPPAAAKPEHRRVIN